MYKLINRHIGQLLDVIDPGIDIQPYVLLVRQLNRVDVSRDLEYQRKYRRYWQLNAARLCEPFCQSYFALLEGLKRRARGATVGTVAQQLLQVPCHNNGQRALQFSFASKLVHMLNPQLPVWDSMVESYYFLPKGSTIETTEQKLQRLLASYDFLCVEYNRILQQGALLPAIRQFRQRYRLGSEYSDIKVIDTLIWKFVGFLRSGAVRSGQVMYD